MNTPKSDLHALIVSLSTSEKRFFRQYAARKKRKGEFPLYFELFERMQAIDEYDEAQLRASLKGTPLGRRFREHKHYLQEALLAALSEFHAQAHIYFEIRQLLTEYQILAGKNHLSLAYKRLEKAKTLCQQYENLLGLQEIAQYEKNLIFRDFFESEDREMFERIESEECQAMADSQRLFEQEHVFHEVRMYYLSRVQARSEADLEQMKRLSHAPVNQGEAQLKLMRSKLMDGSNRSLYYAMKGDYEAALEVSQNTLDQMEAQPHRINEWPTDYKVFFRNMLQLRIRLNKIDAGFYERLSGLTQAYPYESRSDVAKNHIISLSLELSARVREGQFELAHPRLKLARELLEKHPTVARADLAMIVFNAFYVSFGVRNYSEALQWIRLLDGELRDNLRKDLHSLTRLMEILAHYELGDEDILPYQIRNTERYFNKHHPERKFERLMLKGLSKIVNQIPDSPQRREVFANLRDEVEVLFESEFERSVQLYFDFLAWLTSHCERKAFDACVQIHFRQAQ